MNQKSSNRGTLEGHVPNRNSPPDRRSKPPDSRTLKKIKHDRLTYFPYRSTHPREMSVLQAYRSARVRCPNCMGSPPPPWDFCRMAEGSERRVRDPPPRRGDPRPPSPPLSLPYKLIGLRTPSPPQHLSSSLRRACTQH